MVYDSNDIFGAGNSERAEPIQWDTMVEQGLFLEQGRVRDAIN